MIEKWKVKRSHYIVSDEWLKLRADDCDDAGVSIAPYYVFEYRPWVTIVPVTTYQQIVLIRQYRHGSGQIEVELPAGNSEPEDPDLLHTAARELTEETGYQSDNLLELSTVCANSATHTNLSHLILAKDAYPAGGQQLDATENIDVFTLPITDLPQALDDGMFKQSMHVSALYFAMQHLGYLKWHGK